MRVVIAEDAAMMREGLVRLLTDRGIEVCAAVADAEALRSAVAAAVPDVAIIDIRMPPTHTDEGLRAAIDIRRDHPDVGVLVFSQYVETRYATRLLADRPTGVGYLLKDRVADVADFVDALTRVASGGTALDPEVVGHLMRAGQDTRRGGVADPAGARGALADGRGTIQRRDRGGARHHRRGRGEARGEHLREARPAVLGQRQPPGPGRPAPPAVLSPGLR